MHFPDTRPTVAQTRPEGGTACSDMVEIIRLLGAPLCFSVIWMEGGTGLEVGDIWTP